MGDAKQPPGFARRAKNAAAAALRFAGGGFRLADKPERARRLEICRTCDRHDNGRCLECGCFVAAKARLASESCPLGRWALETRRREDRAASPAIRPTGGRPRWAAAILVETGDQAAVGRLAAGLRAAGVDDLVLMIDAESDQPIPPAARVARRAAPLGCWRGWLQAVRDLRQISPSAERLLLLGQDAVLPAGLPESLDEAGPVLLDADRAVALTAATADRILRHPSSSFIGGRTWQPEKPPAEKDDVAGFLRALHPDLPAGVPALGDDVTRNLLYHVYPTRGKGLWQWNLDQLRRRLPLFNGRRVIAIATDAATDPPGAVEHHMAGEDVEFLRFSNQPALREAATLVPLLETVADGDPQTVTFFGHAKAVRHQPTSICRHWAQRLYEIALDYWPLAARDLSSHAVTGPFKKYGAFARPGNHAWHYSGTFYWIRHAEMFGRAWREIDRFFAGAEAWPGRHFRAAEAGCLFHQGDLDMDLYSAEYWQRVVEPKYQRWMQHNAPFRTP